MPFIDGGIRPTNALWGSPKEIVNILSKLEGFLHVLWFHFAGKLTSSVRNGFASIAGLSISGEANKSNSMQKTK